MSRSRQTFKWSSFHIGVMMKRTKESLVTEVIRRRKEILANEHAKQALVDAIIPLASFNAEILSFNDDGTVTIRFNDSIDGYVNYLTKSKMVALLDAINDPLDEQ